MKESPRWFRLAGLALALALLLPQATSAAGRARVYALPSTGAVQGAGPVVPIGPSVAPADTAVLTATAPITLISGSVITHALGAIHETAPDPDATVQQVLVDLPTAIDWRDYNGGNYISPVQDQGECGSCWAFSSVAALESLQAIAAATPGTFRDLSEQIVVSCDLYNSGCSGGFMSSVASFLRSTGTNLETCYPYAAAELPCSGACADYPTKAYKTYAYISVPRTLEALKSALQYGPLAVTFDVYSDFDNYYTSGVYQYDGYGYHLGGHAVLLVGYQDLPGQYGGGYFICKNSWGAAWGEDGGYFRIGYNQLSYPIYFGGDAYRYALAVLVVNDDFDQATVIASAPYSGAQDTTGAISAADDPGFTCVSIGKGYNSVWFEYRPTYSGLMTVTTAGSSYDTLLGVWTGTRGALVSRGCNDDLSGLQSQVVVSVTANITYYIEVAGYLASDYGTLMLGLTCTPAPLAAPVLEPIENADGDGIYLISWSEQPSRRSDTYLLQEATDVLFTRDLRTVGITTEQKLTVTGKLTGICYYRVKGQTASEDSLWSNVSSTTVRYAYYLFSPLVYGIEVHCMPVPYNEGLLYNMSKVKAPQAWPCAQGGEGVIIAILDTGADSDHPDLQANLVAGTFFTGTSTEDDYGHGTHVSGIAAGVANNGGIFGVAPHASIMPIKVCDSGGLCSWEDVANGIMWTADHGAQVINMSLGSSDNSTILYNAVRYAYEQGVAVICSAGNSGIFTDTFPASYAEVIAVAATDSNDNRASFSTYGAWVDVASPGVSILSSYPWYYESGYFRYMDGTSMAAPHVAGMAALIRKLRPAWTVDQVYTHIRSSVDDVGDPGFDYKTGYGRINAQKAVDALSLAQTDALNVPVLPQAALKQNESDPAEFVPGVVLFKLRPGATLAAILNEATINAASMRAEVAVAQLGVLRLHVPAGEELSWLKLLRSLPEVEYAELNGIMHIQ